MDTINIPEYNDVRNLPLDGSVKLAFVTPLFQGSISHIATRYDPNALEIINQIGAKRELVMFTEVNNSQDYPLEEATLIKGWQSASSDNHNRRSDIYYVEKGTHKFHVIGIAAPSS